MTQAQEVLIKRAKANGGMYSWVSEPNEQARSGMLHVARSLEKLGAGYVISNTFVLNTNQK